MIQRDTATTGILIVLLAIAGGAGMFWILGGKANETAKPSTPPVPANVPKTAKEEQLTTFSLKPEAEEALKLQFGKIERKPLPRTRFYGGEVTVPPGQTIIVSAPFSGVLQTVKGVLPQIGAHVNKGDTIFNIVPLLTAEGRANLASALVEAQGQINNAESNKKATVIVRDRARTLLMDDAGSKRQFDDADAAYELALSVLKAAEDRKKKLEELAGDAEKNTATALPIQAPATGILRNVTASSDQNVPGGAILFEVLDISSVWIRVPIHVADEAELDASGSALVGRLTARPEKIGPPAKDKEKLLEAKRVDAPPSANNIAGSIDIWFKLDNKATNYRPGQRVGVTLPIQSEPMSLTVPWSAVVHDINGGTWVYEPLADHTFVRRRVIVHYVRDGMAALAVGPKEGTKVVSVGAAELFGTETGFSK
jgi:biotin carboxyl carrier protein